MKKHLNRIARIHWIGIKFSEIENEATTQEQISFGEALSKAVVSHPLILTRKNFAADNLKYLLGWHDQLQLDNNGYGIDKSVLEQIVADTRPINKKVNSIIFNSDDADIFIGSIQPEGVSSILKKWYFKTGKLPAYLLSPLSLDCIACAIKCFNENYPVFSFGSELSRKNGDLRRDRLIVAVPNDSEFLKDELKS
jgi:hypothetical protein